MENKITLKPASPTDISKYKGRIISFLKLQLNGAGKISSCLLNFFNADDKPEDFAVLKLVKPDFSASQTLVPYDGSCLLIMDYDYCYITDVDGNVLNSDKLFVILSEPKIA